MASKCGLWSIGAGCEYNKEERISKSSQPTLKTTMEDRGKTKRVRVAAQFHVSEIEKWKKVSCKVMLNLIICTVLNGYSSVQFLNTQSAVELFEKDREGKRVMRLELYYGCHNNSKPGYVHKVWIKVLHRRLFSLSYRRKYVGLFDFVFLGVSTEATANLLLDLVAEHFFW